MYEIKSKTCKNGYVIKAFYDEDSECPRDWDNLGKLYSNHRKYDFDKASIEELIADVDGNIYSDVIPWDKIEKKYIYAKVYALDHSQLRVKIADSDPFSGYYHGFDSGLFGVLAIPIKDALKEYGKYKRNCEALRERVLKCWEGEIETLDHWLNGEVYGYRIYKNDDEIDSCWGFYDLDEMFSEAEAIVDWECEKEFGKELF